jgi:predicted acetyltransferase
MPDDVSAITLRTPTEDTLRAFVQPLLLAFGAEWGDAEFEMERRQLEIDRVIGAFDGETIVACSGAFTFRLTVPGGEIGAAGVTLIGVSPTHRRRGILRLMMADLFAQARERGEPVAVLWASEAAIYQRFGYGMATAVTWFAAATDKIRFSRPVEPFGRVRLVERDEAVALCSAIYEARRPSIVGALNRPDAKWRHQLVEDAEFMRNGNGAKVRAILEVDGEARAYAIYRNNGDFGDAGPQGVVTVLEVLGLDAAAEQVLWQWLFSLDLIATVRGWRGPTPHPLSMMVTEPRRLQTSNGDGMWLRILDLKAALEGRRYRGPGTVTFDVSDDLLPENAGRWQLTVAGPDGAASVAPAPASAAIDVALDIRDLAAVYLGTSRFGDLAGAGRVTECRPGALADADALFATSTSPWTATAF